MPDILGSPSVDYPSQAFILSVVDLKLMVDVFCGICVHHDLFDVSLFQIQIFNVLYISFRVVRRCGSGTDFEVMSGVFSVLAHCVIVDLGG